jgi:hypothetical protein
MVLMACSGYHPSHAAKLWHEFETISNRQAMLVRFFMPYHNIIQERLEALKKKGENGVLRMVLESMVKDGLLHMFDDDNDSGVGKTHDSFVYPGYVTSFPLEPSIHPYDGTFTGRVSVLVQRCSSCTQRDVSRKSSHTTQILLDPVGPCLCQFNDGRRCV